MRWLIVLALAVSALGCNRTPTGEPQAEDRRPVTATAPADWARRHAAVVGTPQLNPSREAGQPGVHSPAVAGEQSRAGTP